MSPKPMLLDLDRQALRLGVDLYPRAMLKYGGLNRKALLLEEHQVLKALLL